MEEKILQFGEGNFLRAFIDSFIDQLNEAKLFNGKIVVIQPIEQGMADIINQQKGRYSVLLRDANEQSTREVTSISRVINPYRDYEEYIETAKNPSLRFVISNTTEAGIAFEKSDRLSDEPPSSFPGKLTALLYERYKFFDGDASKGFIFIPCELIDDNGIMLKKTILQTAQNWDLPDGFTEWLHQANHFTNTLVDRIVTGHPKEETDDPLLVAAEPFHFFAIETQEDAVINELNEKLPFAKLGLNVVICPDVSPYKTRKVRILNGAHTMSALAAYLSGIETVGEMMADPLFADFLQKGIFDEILPYLDLDKKDIEEFASSVLTRFRNPYIEHKLISIALNSEAKFEVRVLPSILAYFRKKGELPKHLCFSYAALVAFCGEVYYKELDEIPGFTDITQGFLKDIKKLGMRTALANMMQSKLTINQLDNVAVSIKDGHKTAICDIAAGELVIKYGYPIGSATQNIAQGEHVHSHNLKTNLSGLLDYEYKPQLTETIAQEGTFMGYLRKNGSVGIRNEIWIINTVGCVNKPAERIATLSRKKYGTEEIYNFDHPYGCSQLGEDHLNTQKILRGMVNHPNAAGVLVFGLGCENNTIDSFKEILGEYDPERVKFLTAQDHEDEISKGVELIGELVAYANTFSRSLVAISNLCIGLKCGASDGFSGITANPLAGAISDKLIAHGGTALLSEVPEMFGAETLLMNRAVNKEVFEQTVALINNFKKYFNAHGQEIYENPSPGNKEGGITTLEEKSLGCTQKGGTSNVEGVLEYGEKPVRSGLHLLNGPGNDIVSITSLMAAGAHIILFSTGRGTPVGAPIPTVKISSNSELARKKPNWIDYDAGTLLAGNSMTADFWDYLISVAEGRKTKNEENNYREISIFKDGVTL